MTALRSPFARGFTSEAADDLAATLKVLADPTRLKILSLLHFSGPMTGVEVGSCLPLQQPTVSYHLKMLAAAGLITVTYRGVFHTRSLRAGRMRALALLLDPGQAS
jgi:ArsR family transcriptional regulator